MELFHKEFTDLPTKDVGSCKCFIFIHNKEMLQSGNLSRALLILEL